MTRRSDPYTFKKALNREPTTVPDKDRRLRFNHEANSWQVNSRTALNVWNNISCHLARAYAAKGFEVLT